jgi:hypothetical protein
MDFDDLVRELAPPPNRVGKCVGTSNIIWTKARSWWPSAMHLLRTTSTPRKMWDPCLEGNYNKGHTLRLENVDRSERAGWERLERRMIGRRRSGERNHLNDHGFL